MMVLVFFIKLNNVVILYGFGSRCVHNTAAYTLVEEKQKCQ